MKLDITAASELQIVNFAGSAWAKSHQVNTAWTASGVDDKFKNTYGQPILASEIVTENGSTDALKLTFARGLKDGLVLDDTHHITGHDGWIYLMIRPVGGRGGC